MFAEMTRGTQGLSDTLVEAGGKITKAFCCVILEWFPNFSFLLVGELTYYGS